MPTSPYRTPPPGTTPTGTAVPLPPAYAQLNTAADGSIGIRKYIDDSYQKTGHLPNGFHAENGHAVEDEPGFLFRHPWLFPVIGVTAGLALPAVVGAAPAVAGDATAGGAFDAAGNFVGASTVSSVAPTAAASAIPYSTIVSSGTNLFGNLFGAHEQASAASDAARINAEAQERIAAANAKAAADALAFSKSSAENGFQNNEVARAGNYDQWAAAQRRIGSVAKLLGFGDREIPAYRPGVDPHYDGGGGPAGTTPPAAQMPGDGEVNWTAPADQLGAQLTAYFTKRGVNATEVPYWVQQAGSLVTRGQELNDPLYASKRLAAADVFGKSSAPPAAAPNPYALSRYL